MSDKGAPGRGAARLVTAHTYAARDRSAAESMADAMAAFGYAEVGARPTHRRYLLDNGMGWELVVVDDIPYPPDNRGLQQELAVQRRALSIARAHGGFGFGSRSDRVFFVDPAPPVLRLNPGSRPPVPRIPEVTAPPRGDLALVPDQQVRRPPRMDGLDAMPWSELAHATGTDPIPAQIVALAHARDDKDWHDRILELQHRIMPNGDPRPDTAPAVTILARLLIEDALTALRRCGVYWLLIAAACQYPLDVITYADIVAATGRPPRPFTWAEQARDAVAAAVPALLARWDIEPPANRLALAALAAAFPAHGQLLADRVAALAASQQRTQVGSCAQVAHQLITGDYRAAARNATALCLCGGSRAVYDIENELLEPATLAEAILAEQVEQLLPL